MSQTDGLEKLTPEQVVEIKKRIMAYEQEIQTQKAAAKVPADDTAGRISPADLAFGSILQDEWKDRYYRNASTIGKLRNGISYQEIGKVGAPSKRNATKRASLWRRLVIRFVARRSKETPPVV